MSARLTASPPTMVVRPNSLSNPNQRPELQSPFLECFLSVSICVHLWYSFASCRPGGNAPWTSMASGTQQTRRRLRAREIRMLLYLLVLLGVVAWKFVPRPWHPAIALEAPHHLIYSSATPAQTSRSEEHTSE